ncbi:MAG: hypothetical protein WC455_17810 [Dehalococcoidia bacterium]|jgi:hypothetical protein
MSDVTNALISLNEYEKFKRLKETEMGTKRKTARRQFKGWLKHWYLGGGTTENRDILTPEAKAEEQMVMRELHRMVDRTFSEDAEPLKEPWS